jgi:hypothetical protein
VVVSSLVRDVIPGVVPRAEYEDWFALHGDGFAAVCKEVQ